MTGFFKADACEPITREGGGFFENVCTTESTGGLGFFGDTCLETNPCRSRAGFFIDFCLDDPCSIIDPCLPYACDALSESILEAQPLSVVAIGAGPSDLDYPFATTRPDQYGHPDFFSAWNFYISGPAQVTTWTDYPGIRDIQGLEYYDNLSKAEFCNVDTGLAQATTHIAEFQANVSVTATTPPTRFIGGAGSGKERSGSSSTAIVTAWRSDGAIQPLNFVNNHAGRFFIYRNGVLDTVRTIQMYSNFTSTGMQFGSGEGATIDTGLIDFGETIGADEWVYVTLTEQSSVEFGYVDELLRDNYRCIVTMQVTMTRESTGQTLQDTCSGYVQFAQANNTGEWTYGPGYDQNFYNSPYFFRGSSTDKRLSWALLSHGPAILDHAPLHTAFKRNMSDYVIPEYCV